MLKKNERTKKVVEKKKLVSQKERKGNALDMFRYMNE